MHVLNKRFGVRHCNIVVCKVPEALDADVNQQIRKLFHIVRRYAKKRAIRLVINAEILDIINIAHGNSLNHLAADSLVLIKNAYKPEAAVNAENLVANRFAEIAGRRLKSLCARC
jgi:hypothetical protein